MRRKGRRNDSKKTVFSMKTFIIVTFAVAIAFVIVPTFLSLFFRKKKDVNEAPTASYEGFVSQDLIRYKIAQPRRKNRVAMMMLTKYDMMPGGVEGYFLTSAAVYQSMGYHVDILVVKEYRSLTLGSLNSTAASLRIKLNYKKLSLFTVTIENSRIDSAYLDRYDIFFLIGYQKYPDVYGLARNLNIYVCQFPSDLEALGNYNSDDIIRDYDMILVNSRYVFGWYTNLIQPTFKRLRDLGYQAPSVQILYPPVDPFRVPSITGGFGDMPYITVNSTGNNSLHDRSLLSARSLLERSLMLPKHIHKENVMKIVVLGGFYRGRRSKGHDVALRLLQKLISNSVMGSGFSFHLTLIGSLDSSLHAHSYMEELQANVTALKLPVTLIPNASPAVIAKTLSYADVFWSLTGVKDDGDVSDPTSVETFGIAVVEAMSVGCIPVVLHIGGTVEIVQHGKNGFLAKDMNDYIQLTMKIASMNRRKLESLRLAAYEKSKEYHVDNFMSKLSIMTHRAFISHSYRRVISLFALKIADVPMGEKEFSVNIGTLVHTNLGAHFFPIFSRQFFCYFPIKLKRLSSEDKKNILAIGLSQEILDTGMLISGDENTRSLSLKFPSEFVLRMKIDSIPIHNFQLLKIAQSPTINTAVIIEPAINSAFEFSVRTTMYHLGPSWGLRVYHSIENSKFVKSVLADLEFVVFIQLKDPIINISQYNKLLKSVDFWKSLMSKKVLLFQSDSAVLRGGIEEFMQYDYIGAPWQTTQAENKKIKILRDEGWLPIAVGNGGFSLRNVDMMIKIIENEGLKSPSHENEDIFFAKHIQRLKGALVSSEIVAYKFCKEVPLIFDSNGDPISGWSNIRKTSTISHFALHAAWHYDPPDVTTELLLSAISPAFRL